MQMPNCPECLLELAQVLFALQFAAVDIAYRHRTLRPPPRRIAEIRRSGVTRGRRLMISERRRWAAPVALRSAPEKLSATPASIAWDCPRELKWQEQECPPKAGRQKSSALHQAAR